MKKKRIVTDNCIACGTEVYMQPRYMSWYPEFDQGGNFNIFCPDCCSRYEKDREKIEKDLMKSPVKDFMHAVIELKNSYIKH